MTRIAVLSDSHGASLRLKRFAEIARARNYGCIYHLGDVLSDVRTLEGLLERPILSVAGNCDMFEHHAREARETVAGKRLLLVHGDLYGVKYGYDRLSYYAEENMMDAALFGHTHRPFAGYAGRVLLVNPGALRNGSFCEMTLTERDIIPRICDADEEYFKVTQEKD